MLQTDPCRDDIICDIKAAEVSSNILKHQSCFVALIKSLQQLYISSTFHLLQERLHRATEQTQSCGQEEQQLRQHQPGSNQTEEEALRTI